MYRHNMMVMINSFWNLPPARSRIKISTKFSCGSPGYRQKQYLKLEVLNNTLLYCILELLCIMYCIAAGLWKWMCECAVTICPVCVQVSSWLLGSTIIPRFNPFQQPPIPRPAPCSKNHFQSNQYWICCKQTTHCHGAELIAAATKEHPPNIVAKIDISNRAPTKTVLFLHSWLICYEMKLAAMKCVVNYPP